MAQDIHASSHEASGALDITGLWRGKNSEIACRPPAMARRSQRGANGLIGHKEYGRIANPDCSGKIESV
jgi:hypothetical protein